MSNKLYSIDELQPMIKEWAHTELGEVAQQLADFMRENERLRELANEARGHLLEKPCNKTMCNIKLLRLIQLGTTKEDLQAALEQRNKDSENG